MVEERQKGEGSRRERERETVGRVLGLKGKRGEKEGKKRGKRGKRGEKEGKKRGKAERYVCTVSQTAGEKKVKNQLYLESSSTGFPPT